MEEEIWGRKLHFFFLLVRFYNFDDNVFRTLEFFSSTRTIYKKPVVYVDLW